MSGVTSFFFSPPGTCSGRYNLSELLLVRKLPFFQLANMIAKARHGIKEFMSFRSPGIQRIPPHQSQLVFHLSRRKRSKRLNKKLSRFISMHERFIVGSFEMETRLLSRCWLAHETSTGRIELNILLK